MKMKTGNEIISTRFESIFSKLGRIDAMPGDLSCWSNAISLTIPNGKRNSGRMKRWNRYLRRRRERGNN